MHTLGLNLDIDNKKNQIPKCCLLPKVYMKLDGLTLDLPKYV